MNVTKATGIHEPQLVLHERSRKQKPRRKIGDGFLPEIPSWNEIRYVEAILISDELTVDLHHAAGALAEFGGVVREIHVHAFDRIDRDIGPESARRRIGQIETVHLISDLVPARTMNMNLVQVVAHRGGH